MGGKINCMEGDNVQVMGSLQSTVNEGTLATFSSTSLFYVVKILCQFKWRELLIVNQWRLKWIMYSFFPPCWYNKISIDHFLKWVIFGLGFLTSWWISRKLLTYADVISHLSFKVHELSAFIFKFLCTLVLDILPLDWTLSTSHTYLTISVPLGTVRTKKNE